MSDLSTQWQALQEGRAFFPVHQRFQLRVSGADRLRYLNGQISNDLQLLRENAAMHACVLTAKGKLEAEVFVWKEEAALVVDAPELLRDTLPLRLEKYAIADDVVFDAVELPLSLIHLRGTPPELSGVETRFIARFLREPGTDLQFPAEREEEIFNALTAAGFLQVSPEAVELYRIALGEPLWGCELDASILPAEARLDETSISFSKGCYIGQEVVSRIRSVGRVNRRLFGWRGETPLEAGTELRLPDSQTVAGTVTSSARLPDGRAIGLAYIKNIASSESCLTALDRTSGNSLKIEIHDFPFLT